MNNFAFLRTDSFWYPLFEGGRVPIQNILFPDVAELQGAGIQDVYRVDVSRLSPEQIKEIAARVAAQCHGTPREVERDMRLKGFIPLRASHVSNVASDSLAFL